MSKNNRRRASGTNTAVLQRASAPKYTKDHESKSTKGTTILAAVIGAAATIIAAAIGVLAIGHTNHVHPTGSATLSPAAPTTSTLVTGDGSSFIKDVTYPDRSKVRTGQHFIKKWEIKDTGDVRWVGRYLAPIGQSTGSCTYPSRVPVPTTNPGQSVVISVPVTAASSPQLCYVIWKMVTSNNILYFPDFVGIWFEVYVVKGP
jgi:hypothetical protein